MELYRDDKVGFWKLDASEEEREQKPDYLDALPRYLNGLDSIFAKAMERDEAQLILSLLGIRGMQTEGWDPTTRRSTRYGRDPTAQRDRGPYRRTPPLALDLRPHRRGGGPL